ncbi:hypothetical protein NBRC116585_21420 [Thalassolituus maritimus]|uniref:Cardiolipin synthase N-terminal domain-containing protein n=1 Tax=Thalassolituus maritimus TaxID=484498 RepID=A0ABQ0A0W5_9GAMM
MEIWTFIFLSWVVLNLSVSILIVRRADLDSFQKAAQIAIVWIIPVIAAIGLWLFHRSNDDSNPGGGPIGGGPNDSIAVHVGGD